MRAGYGIAREAKELSRGGTATLLRGILRQVGRPFVR